MTSGTAGREHLLNTIDQRVENCLPATLQEHSQDTRRKTGLRYGHGAVGKLSSMGDTLVISFETLRTVLTMNFKHLFDQLECDLSQSMDLLSMCCVLAQVYKEVPNGMVSSTSPSSPPLPDMYALDPPSACAPNMAPHQSMQQTPYYSGNSSNTMLYQVCKAVAGIREH